MLNQFFIFEYLISINLIIQVLADLNPTILTWNSMNFDTLNTLLFLILFILKYLFEGNRINSLLYLAFQFIQLSNKYIFQDILINFLAGSLAILYALSIYYVPVLKFPKNTGPYKVGYKIFKISPDANYCAVFYPTRFPTHNCNWAPDSKYWERLYESQIFDKSPFKSRWLFKFVTSYLHSLKINVQVNSLLEEKKEAHPVIIFSHGLGGSMNSYSAFVTELASHGFIVFCPDHKDEANINKCLPELKKSISAQLNQRCNFIRKLIDYLYDKKAVNRLFFQNNVQLNYDTLSVAGHAFGGATAINAAFNDPRIRGACLCLDPVMWPIPDTDLNKGLKKSILSISSGRYWDDHPEFENNEEKIDKLFKANKSFKGSSLNLKMKICSHYNLCDLPNLMPRECEYFKLIDKIEKMENIHDQFKAINRLLYHFFYYMDAADSKITLLEKFREDCGNDAVNDNLIIKN